MECCQVCKSHTNNPISHCEWDNIKPVGRKDCCSGFKLSDKKHDKWLAESSMQDRLTLERLEAKRFKEVRKK